MPASEGIVKEKHDHTAPHRTESERKRTQKEGMMAKNDRKAKIKVKQRCCCCWEKC